MAFLSNSANRTSQRRESSYHLLSGNHDRRRRAFVLSAVASAALHLIILAVLFATIARLFVARGVKETVSQTQVVTIQHAIPPPPPRPPHPARPVRQRESAPAAAAPRHELVKEVPSAPPQPAAHNSVPSPVRRDQAGFAKEVAQLNKQDDPHAIPTIDPAGRESSSKSYAFSPPRGSSEGNGIITPTQSWHDHGRDCYYGRYEYTYPDGANEAGDIAWPFCYDPDSDPFKLPPHPMPFPLPMAGYELPPDEQLPPVEKSVYEQWAAENVRSSP